MKKIIFGCILLNALNICAQAVTISTNNITATQLVNEFLGANNNATSATKSIGNGIGYFQNSNPAFPFNKGIIISTGNVTSITGTSDVSGTGSNTTDANLQTFANSNGLTGGLYDASYLSYNFTATSAQLNFDYIFASEDYGQFQCGFSDVVAFLLTDITTGITTNMATIPGTILPVSVTNIRNSVNNAGCTSVNPQFFDVYNAVNNPAANGTSFNGRTVVMNAFANLTVGNAYKLKLVIGDYQDALYDSSVFIKASPTPTEVLGADLTIANNTAICAGQSYTLSTGLNASNYNFQWFLNGNVILNAFQPTFTANQTGVYQVVYQNILNGSQYTDEIIIENPLPLETFPDVTTCNFFNIAFAQSGDFYTGPNGTGQLIPPGTAITASMTIYVYNGCENSSFVVTIFPAPITSAPQNISINEPNSDGFATFDLSTQIPIILNGLSPNDYQISFYTSYADAMNGINAISDLSSFTNFSNPQTIYSSVTDLASGFNCSNINNFTLNVVNAPAVTFQDFTIFEPSTDGVAVFDLTAQIPAIIGVGANPANFVVTFFTSLEDANNNVNPIENPSQFTNTTNPQTIYVRVTSLNGRTTSTTSIGTMQLYVQETLSTDGFNDLKINISPNPVIDFMIISSKENLDSLAIYNVLGQLVFKIATKSNQEKIDLSTLASGNYFVKINIANNSKVVKIIKQ